MTLGALSVIALFASSAPASPRAVELIDAGAHDCTEAVPAATSVNHLTAPDVIDLDVLLVLNGVPEADGRAVMAEAAKAFSPIGVTLSVAAVQHVTIGPTGKTAQFSGDPGVASIGSQELIDATKALVGGERPSGIDVVYTMSAVSIADAAGRADCIGGSRWDDQAFAVGEYQVGPGNEGDSARIAAHEVAHLLGAHHHYTNCVEGAIPEADEPDPYLTACTLMAPDLGLVSLHLGVVEAPIVRGHAEEYVSP
ncbi:MAG TPA: zinc-dependent metalloprotease family protein [Actinomycetota bacterium]|nr:zinc-dependent metalloprotease family protein [Actinomycetota bacterium]